MPAASEVTRQDVAAIRAQWRVISVYYVVESVSGEALEPRVKIPSIYQWRSGVFSHRRRSGIRNVKDLADRIVCNALVACISTLDPSPILITLILRSATHISKQYQGELELSSQAVHVYYAFLAMTVDECSDTLIKNSLRIV